MKRALDLLDAGCWSREATIEVIKGLLSENLKFREALEQIRDRYAGICIDRSAGEFKQIARKALEGK